MTGGPIDAYAAALLLGAAGRVVKPATIRVWAHRGKVKRCGRDGHGRALYSLADIWAHAIGTEYDGNTT